MDLHVPSDAIRHEALVVVTGGDAHTRSQFCHDLVAGRDANTLVSHIVAPVFCDDDLLDRMLSNFGIVSDDEMRSRQRAGVSVQQMSEAVHRFLAGLVPLKARALLMIENAQDAGSVLEQIGKLASLEDHGRHLLQIVLVAASDFQATLSLSDYIDLKSRVTAWHELPRVGLGGLLRARVSLPGATAAVVVASVLAAGVAAALYLAHGFLKIGAVESAAMADPTLAEFSDLLREDRSFPPSPAFAAAATVRDPKIYADAERDFEAFWARFASELEWSKHWDRVLEWNPPHAKWFVGGTINASVNCVDRHARGAKRNKAAIIWEGEPGDTRTLTYHDLLREVSQCANVLRSLGVRKGDRVALYLPLIPELAIAMLACARIGAVHSVVFGGFSAESLRDRINDSQCRLLITADGGYRRGQVVALKQVADEAVEGTPSIEHVIVVRRNGAQAADSIPVTMKAGRDRWYHELMAAAPLRAEPEAMDAEDMLYILYTSGTTGKPKGIVHTTGGYLTGTYATTKLVFDMKDEDVYWCTADIGWVTGHSYVVYGPLANGATVVMYEGAPDWPKKDRFWSLIEKYGVTIFYTAPTAIRAFMKWGTEWPAQHDLSSLRLIGSVGEPINPEAWVWYHKVIGGERCPIVDTWWQTETGAIMITPLPGVTTTRPGSATHPFPGIAAEIRNERGDKIDVGGGLLALTRPWPSMLRGIYGDPDRYVKQYWNKWGTGVYVTGDGAKRDADGNFWLLGRVDDVINVAGHRIGTMEVESALVDHPSVAEAAVVGRAHEIKGQAIAAFVTLKEGRHGSKEHMDLLKEHVAHKIGAIARPDDILFAADLPKTRSGKIMRRLLRDIAEGKALGDTTTLADPGVVARLKTQYEDQEG